MSSEISALDRVDLMMSVKTCWTATRPWDSRMWRTWSAEEPLYSWTTEIRAVLESEN